MSVREPGNKIKFRRLSHLDPMNGSELYKHLKQEAQRCVFHRGMFVYYQEIMKEIRAHYKDYPDISLYYACQREDDNLLPVWIRVKDATTDKDYYVCKVDKRKKQ
jgi:hypothetical protein